MAISLLCGLCAAPSPALAAREVSYPVLLRQVESGPLIRAIINRSRDDIEIKFRDLSEWEAFYPPGARPRLERLLRERRIRLIFASRPHTRSTTAAAQHHLRYIVAGAWAAVLLIGAGAYAFERRRRKRGRSAAQAAPAPRPRVPNR